MAELQALPHGLSRLCDALHGGFPGAFGLRAHLRSVGQCVCPSDHDGGPGNGSLEADAARSDTVRRFFSRLEYGGPVISVHDHRHTTGRRGLVPVHLAGDLSACSIHVLLHVDRR